MMADFEIEKICCNYGLFGEVIADTDAAERVLCTSLNLHSGALRSCAGLDAAAFPALRELNLSSNRIATSDLPEISYLQGLESLDLSGNLIRDVEMLPFLPSLQRLALAFNPLQSLMFLNEVVPNLRVLDMRGHQLASLRSQRHFLSPLSCLAKLQELLLVGKARIVDAADVLGVFSAVPSLQHVDGLREEQWRADFATQENNRTSDEQQQHISTAVEGSDEGLAVDTPKFDEVARVFKARLLGGGSSSGVGGGHPPDEFESDSIADRSAFGTSADYANGTPATLVQTREASCSPIVVDDKRPQQYEEQAMEPMVSPVVVAQLLQAVHAGKTPSPAMPPDPSTRAELPLPLETPLLPPPSSPPMAIQLSLARLTERQRMKNLHRAFDAVRKVVLISAREAALREQARKHALELELLGKRLLQERSRADASARRLVQSEAVQMSLRRQLGVAAKEVEMIQIAASESAAREGERGSMCVELASRVEQLRAAEAAGASDRDALKLLCDQLRREHSSQLAAARADSETQRLQTLLLLQQLEERDRSAAEQTGRLLDQCRQAQEQLYEERELARKAADDKHATLQALNEASQALAREEQARAERAEVALEVEKDLRSRAERRVQAAQHAFEQGTEQLSVATRERQVLYERNSLLATKVEELSACMRRLQASIHQAEQRAAEQRAAEQRAVLRHTADKGMSPAPSSVQKVADDKAAGTAAAASAELMSRLDGLEDGLVRRTEELRDAHRRLFIAEGRAASSEQQLQDLHLALRVKDKLLEDHASAAAGLRAKGAERERESRRLVEALARAEARLERCDAEALEMEEELAATARVERELRRLLEDLRCEGGWASGCADDSPCPPSVIAGGQGQCRSPVCARERSRLAAEVCAERSLREAAEAAAAEQLRREAERAAAAGALQQEQARVLADEKARCEAALQDAAGERRALQRAVKRLEGDCLRRDGELQASRRRVGLLKNALVEM